MAPLFPQRPASQRRPRPGHEEHRPSGSPCCGCLRYAVWADRGKNHNPAAMTPDITAASRRARLRQDRCAPLRGGLRPVLTQSLLGALIAHGPGQKAALHAELKASWGLPTGPRLKNGKNAARPNRETPSRSAWRQPRTLLLTGGNLGLRPLWPTCRAPPSTGARALMAHTRSARHVIGPWDPQ